MTQKTESNRIENKVGHFTFTVTDLEIPVSGIPIRVNRSYDTRKRHQQKDFGYGWTIDYRDIKVEESRAPGRQWAAPCPSSTN